MQVPDRLQCTDVGALGERLRDPEKGVSVQDRRHLLRTYPKTFVGSELADWVFNNVVGLRSRREAVQICQQLMDTGLFRPVSRRRQGKPFYDAWVLYRFTVDYLGGECDEDEDDSDILGENNKISSDQLDDVLVAIRNGVEVKKRRHFLRSYDQCFVGAEATDWLVDKFNVSRVQAVELGQKMLAMGFFEHVSDETRPFEDANEYYRFVDSVPEGPQITDKTTLYDFNVLDIDHNPVSLRDYAGQVVLVVNVASF